ncbi:uncharacterized protein LOC109727125 [Ananas comosus]|uniref:Uncharacterized protein LOC109727125 n=2 Tax=Ananas comosus TaxID=4615 RepID=A0A6P5GXU4_ANACO|nr:uncharacterized protein LOC109727125 [Ananas comosus]
MFLQEAQVPARTPGPRIRIEARASRVKPYRTLQLIDSYTAGEFRLYRADWSAPRESVNPWADKRYSAGSGVSASVAAAPVLHFFALAIVAALAASSPSPSPSSPSPPSPYLFLSPPSSFPPTTTATATSPSPPPSFTRNKPIFSVYVAVASLLGLVLPMAYIAHGLLLSSDDDDNGALAAAAPHLFLLAAQLFLEGAAAASGFSLPAFAAVPIAYNSRRMFALADWVRREAARAADGPGVSTLQVLAGRVLASANLVFWAFNLFGFLLPIYLPWALKTHYSAHYKDDESKDKDMKKE